MKLSRIELVKAVKGIPPDILRKRDEIDATDAVSFDFIAADEVVEVREGGAIVLLIPRDNVAAMTPKK